MSMRISEEYMARWRADAEKRYGKTELRSLAKTFGVDSDATNEQRTTMRHRDVKRLVSFIFVDISFIFVWCMWHTKD